MLLRWHADGGRRLWGIGAAVDVEHIPRVEQMQVSPAYITRPDCMMLQLNFSAYNVAGCHSLVRAFIAHGRAVPATCKRSGTVAILVYVWLRRRSHACWTLVAIEE